MWQFERVSCSIFVPSSGLTRCVSRWPVISAMCRRSAMTWLRVEGRTTRIITIATLALPAVILASLIACAGDIHYRGRSTGEWVDQLSNADARARIQAADALAAILSLQPNNPAAVQALVRALDDSVPIVQGAAGAALGATAVRKTDAVPSLLLALRDSLHPRTRAQAATVLGTLEASVRTAEIPSSIDREAIAALTLALEDPEPLVRATAVRQLSRATSASSRLHDIIRLAADSSPAVRLETAKALGAMGPLIPKSLDALSVLVKDSISEVRFAAQQSSTWATAVSSEARVRNARRRQ